MSSFESLLSMLPSALTTACEIIESPAAFGDFAAPHAGDPGSVVLLSGGDLDCARYNVLAVRPWLSLQCRGRRATLSILHRKAETDINPLDALDQVVNHCSRTFTPAVSGPLSSGLLGYLSYDLKDHIEVLPRTCMPRSLPDLYMVAPACLVVQDKRTGDTCLHTPVFTGGALARDLNQFALDAGRRFKRTATSFPGSPSPPPESQPSGKTVQEKETAPAGEEKGAGFRGTTKLTSNFTRYAYTQAVKRIIDYIRAGDIYQVNLSQRYEAGFEGDPYALFQALFHQNPAPFFSYVHAGDHQIISTSPERFVQQVGRRLETRPIKGTLPRGRTPAEDRQLGDQLLGSAKDDAELSMIVDLMRNDLGRVAKGGSVRVSEHKRLEPYDNVFHLVSVVTAQLSRGASSVDVIRALFPGGSITGCPKIRSMEIIDELETVNRHVYTGSVGYISFHDTMDLSIAIRTATVAGGGITYAVGGGIVYDSDPDKEYEETLHKGRTLMDILSLQGQSPSQPKALTAWANGRFLSRDRVMMPAVSRGVQYGAGLFETLRVDRGRPLMLDAHVRRFNSSWRTLFNVPPPEITWEIVIDTLIRMNGLADGVAAVKIMGCPGSDTFSGVCADKDAFLGVFAQPYVHRLKVLNRMALRLITCPEKRETPLAAHKTLNYLYYDRAGRFARSMGGDEALILNADGTVSETHTCSLLGLRNDCFLLPRSRYALPGVTVTGVVKLLRKAGFRVEEVPIRPGDLKDLDHLYVANSLMGMVPVVSVDSCKMVPDEDYCRVLNQEMGWTLEKFGPCNVKHR